MLKNILFPVLSFASRQLSPTNLQSFSLSYQRDNCVVVGDENGFLEFCETVSTMVEMFKQKSYSKSSQSAIKDKQYEFTLYDVYKTYLLWTCSNQTCMLKESCHIT